MKLLKQAIIIFGISFIGDTLSNTFNLPIPGSIIGITILFCALFFKVIKLDDVETVGNWLKDHMALLFIPITVSLMEEFDVISPHLAQLTLMMILSTLVTYISVAMIIKKVNHDS